MVCLHGNNKMMINNMDTPIITRPKSLEPHDEMRFAIESEEFSSTFLATVFFDSLIISLVSFLDFKIGNYGKFLTSGYHIKYGV